MLLSAARVRSVCVWPLVQRVADVILLMLRSAFAQVITGLAVGLTLSFVAGRMLHARLFEVGEVDLAALSAATVVLLLSALIASLIPAWRAADVEPSEALRAD